MYTIKPIACKDCYFAVFRLADLQCIYLKYISIGAIETPDFCFIRLTLDYLIKYCPVESVFLQFGIYYYFRKCYTNANRYFVLYREKGNKVFLFVGLDKNFGEL